MNVQPAEKQDYNPLGKLQVFKVFPTIQGEGPLVGQRAIFIRLSGCNLQCPMCDTDYTSERIEFFPIDLLQIVKAHGGPGHLVVITGGEPFRQNLLPLVNTLLENGYRVQIETNGTLYQELPFHNITIVCSPKTGSVHRKLAPHIAAYKYVLSGKACEDDGLPMTALGHSAAPRLARPHAGFRGITYLQPADEIAGKEGSAEQILSSQLNKLNLHETIKSVMKHGYTLGMQLHKIIHME